MKWLAIIFPYRTHLEAEITYLKEQLAQRQRRVDELQEMLAKSVEKPTPVARIPAGTPIAVKTRGWDAYRSQIKRKQSDEPEEVEATPV